MNRQLVLIACGIIALNVAGILFLSDDPVPAPPPAKPLVEVRLLLPENCPDCFDMREYLSAWNGLVNMSVSQGDPALFGAGRLPAVAIGEGIESYPERLIENWELVGEIVEVEGRRWYVLPTLNPPYVEEGRVRGRVEVTVLAMAACVTCYDAGLHEEFLAESGIVPSRTALLDIDTPQGRELKERYNITRVPTIILSSDAQLYPGFLPGWKVVGTVEEDGALVLRGLSRLNLVHYDLEAGRVVTS